MVYFFIFVVIVVLIYIAKSSTGQDNVTVSIKVDDKGHPILTLTDSSGKQITNPSIIRKVKRTEKYKRGVEGLIEEHKKKIAEEKLRLKEEKEREKEKERLRKLEEKQANKFNIANTKPNNDISPLK